MKKMHIHISVPDLADSILFYTGLFDSGPTKLKSDYAKWDLEEPPVNFAISTGSRNIGLDHLGIQVDSEAEVEKIKCNLEQASQSAGERKSGVVWYGEASRSWSTDRCPSSSRPMWTLKDAEMYGEDSLTNHNSGCHTEGPGDQQHDWC